MKRCNSTENCVEFQKNKPYLQMQEKRKVNSVVILTEKNVLKRNIELQTDVIKMIFMFF